MKWYLYLKLFYLSTTLNIVFANDSPCQEEIPIRERPVVEYLNESRVIVSNTFILENKTATTVIELKCTFNKPITWEFKSDPWSNHWADYFWVLSERNVKDFYDPSSYMYSIYLRLRRYDPKLPRTFICHQVSNKCVNTKVFLNTSAENTELMEFATLNPIDDVNKTWADAFIEDEKECRAKFIIQPVGPGKLRYKCVSHDDTELEKKNFGGWFFCYHSEGCRNQLYMTKHKPRCVSVLKANDSCDGCTTSHDLSVRLIQCKEKDGESKDRYVQMLTYSLESDISLPKLYLSWETFDLRNFIRFEEIPQKVYVGDVIKTKCHLSPYVFAAPAYMALRFSNVGQLVVIPNPIKFEFKTGKTEFSNFFDGGNDNGIYDPVRNTFSYNSFLKVTTQFANLQEIYCFGGVWNSSEWVNKSQTVSVLPGNRPSGCNIDFDAPKVSIIPETRALFSTPEFLVVPQGNITFKLNCSSNEPIKWNLNSEGEGDLQDAIRNQTKLSIEYIQKRKTYNSVLQIQLTKSFVDLKPSCEKVSNSCHRTTVVIKNSKAEPSALQISVLPYSDPPTKLPKSTESCHTLFVVKIEDNGQLRWKCVDYIQQSQNMKGVSQIYCENYVSCNIFYQEEAQSSKCLKILQSHENCDGCVIFPKGPSIHSSGYLRNYHRGQVSYQPFFYSLNSPKIYFDLDVAPKEDMLIFGKLNTTLYVKERVSLVCHFSPYYFASGYRFSLLFSNSGEYVYLNESEIEEKYNEVQNVVTITSNIILKTEHLDLDTIICEGTRANKDEIVRKSFNVVVIDSSAPVFVDGNDNVRKKFAVGETPESIICEAFGIPVPQIEWIFPRDLDTTLIEITANGTTLTFTSLQLSHTGSYTCVAANVAGKVEKHFTVEVFDSNTRLTSIIIVSCVAVVAVLLVALGVVIFQLFLRAKRLQMVMMILSDEEIESFRNGFEFVQENASDQNMPIYAAPYNLDYEIALDKISLNRQRLLGSGAYGSVYIGHLDSEANAFAVKTVNPTVDVLFFKALLSEIKVMIFIGEHKHIVKFIGACTENIRNKELYLVTELCPNGNLYNLLVNNRSSFDLVEKSQKNQKQRTQHISQIMTSHAKNDYDNVGEQRKMNTTSFYENMITKFSLADMQKWATQICDGMSFLEMKNIIHGDLATRNILLTSEFDAKIGDFGLSRQLANYATYVKTTKSPMPWRFMAIESLKDMVFSTKTDVWSYGIILWEIYSLGEIPYPGWSLTNDFVNCLAEGLRLSKPKSCDWKMFDCMIKCWNADPAARPSFQDLKSFFATLDCLDHTYENESKQK